MPLSTPFRLPLHALSKPHETTTRTWFTPTEQRNATVRYLAAGAFPTKILRAHGHDDERDEEQALDRMDGHRDTVGDDDVAILGSISGELKIAYRDSAQVSLSVSLSRTAAVCTVDSSPLT